MVTCPKFQKKLDFPIYSLGFAHSNLLWACGGGGGGGTRKTGVINKLILHKVDVKRCDLEGEVELDLGPDEDAPMCLAVHPTHSDIVIAGINTSDKKVENGDNNNCRVFKIFDKDEQIKEVRQIEGVNTVKSRSPDEYQKVVRFSMDGKFVVTGTTDGYVDVFKYPELTREVKPSIELGSRVLDVDINLQNEKLTVVTSDSIKLVYLQGMNKGKINQTVLSADLSKRKLSFHSFRYGRGISQDDAFVVANETSGEDRSYIFVLDAHSLKKKREYSVGKKSIKTFCVSPDGEVIAFACSDFEVTLLHASTLKTLTSTRLDKELTFTSIAISPDRRLLAVGSVGGSCNIIYLPVTFPLHSLNPLITLLIAMTIAGALLAFSVVFHTAPTLPPAETPALVTFEASSASVAEPIIVKTEVPRKDEL